MEGKIKGLVLIVVALMAFIAPAVAQNANDAQSQLQIAQDAIQQMENEGVPTERVQSLLTTANNSYNAQKSLAEEGGEPDYSRTTELTDQILSMKETALRVNDRLNALESRISELENNSNLNLTDVKTAYRDVNQTFNDQRFSEAEDQVEQVYTEISEARSVETQVQAFASAQQQNLAGMYQNTVNYAVENWLTLLIGGTFFGGILFVGGREIKLWRLQKKKSNLVNEKQIVEKMIEQAQREYFVEGKGSKMSFETRMNKFQDMVRDTEEKLNNIENEIERMQGLPVISPDIKARTQDFKDAGDVISESKEVKGSLDRIREQEEKEKQGAQEKDIEVIEDKQDSEENSKETGKDRDESKETEKEEKPVEVTDTEKQEEMVNEYEVLVNESTVKEAKARIDEIEDPDYEALMEAEKANKDRVTLERFLERKLDQKESQEETEGEDSEKDPEEKPVEVIEDSEDKQEKTEEVSEEEKEYSEKDKTSEENKDEKNTKNSEESEPQEVERPVEVKDAQNIEEEEDEGDEEVVEKGGKTVEEAGIEYVQADETEEKESEESSEQDEASAEKTIEEELGKAFASVGNEDEEEIEEESEDVSQGKEVEVKDEEQDSEEENIGGESEKSESSGDGKDSSEKPVEVKDSGERSEDIEESSKEKSSDEKERSEETDESGEGEDDMDIIEKDGKYIDPETGKEFDTESAAKLFKQHFG